jgi:hypothetical protein
MSLDLVILPRENADTYEQALHVYWGEGIVVSDGSGDLEAYAQEVYDGYGDDWPFGGNPIVGDGFVLLTVNPESWESEVPTLVERAHKRGLAVLDPQIDDGLFPPGRAYTIDE